MDRRNFLRTASSFALLAAGATTGVSRVFTESPISSLSGNLYEKNRHKTQRKAKFYLNNWRSVFYMQGGLKQTLA